MDRRVKALATAIVISSLVLPDSAAGSTPGYVVQITLRAPMADALPTQMRETISSIRAALGVSAESARTEGLSLFPELSPAGNVVGYAAVDRLRLRTREPAPGVLARARAVAGEADVSLVAAGTALPDGSAAWDAQWTQFG